MLGVRHRLTRLPPGIRRLAGGIIAGVGYILSPLSWWNDLVVNVPLALAMASLLRRLAGVDLEKGFATSYWLTNVLGLVLMVLGGGYGLRGKVKARDIVISLLVASAYTAAALMIIRLIGA